PEFSSSSDCELLGRTSSGQADGSSQLPLVGLVQLLVSATAGTIATSNRNGIANEPRQNRTPKLNTPRAMDTNPGSKRIRMDFIQTFDVNPNSLTAGKPTHAGV